MAKIDIAGEDYDSFAGEDFAEVYILADPLAAEPWGELDQDGKNRLLVAGTRILKRQPWRDGTPSFEETPEAVAEATAEFAAAVLLGYDLQTPASSVLQVKRQKAGSVEVEFFRDLDNPAYQPPPLPPAVWELIKPMLTVAPAPGGAWLPGAISSGTGRGSITEDCYRGTPYVGFGPGNRDWD